MPPMRNRNGQRIKMTKGFKALKGIDHLMAAGQVKTVVTGGQRFYVASGE